MTEEQRIEVLDAVIQQFPEADKERMEALLNLILMEIDISNTCAVEIEWDKLVGVVTEILYQTMKGELDSGVSSIKRGDTTISYEGGKTNSQSLIAGYLDMINRILGCGGGLEFF
ncbi:hypothetical protein ABQD61_06955 [Enterococcus asini]|uniref:hypothetical protein n=1 Tax=Enterococcus asini TaxID=57732 RepID=UPI0032E4EAB0